ncbi:MAG: lipoprotein insertase outer membrane protein LolB [Gallionella sp.]|nr:lipoprotein insertase outer membrane protein LolB [Gallionella sp.]
MRILMLLLVLLTGCATAPVAVQRPPFVDAPFTFNGRIAVKYGMHHDATDIHWQHRGYDEITLLGPLGYTAARIYRDANGATLDDAYGKHYAAPDAESLMEKTLGWSVPLTDLRYWLVATPSPEGEFKIETNANGQLEMLTQQGWEIRYVRYTTTKANALPLELNMSRMGFDVTLKIDGWEAQ